MWGALDWLRWLRRKGGFELPFKECVELGKESEDGVQGTESGMYREVELGICITLWGNRKGPTAKGAEMGEQAAS